MAHGAFRILEKYANKPLLIDAGKMEIIFSYLKSRCEDDFTPVTPTESEQDSNYSHNEQLGIGVLNIEGPLTYKPVTIMGFDCGGANYQAIKEDFDTMLESGVHTIVLNVDSGGGEAYQCFDTARYLRQRADENNVRIISYVDGLAASAAYGLACVADEIVATSDSEVGSIGVLVKLMNDSKALEQAGYERTFVTAGKNKVPFASDGSFTKEFLSDLQGKVDETYSDFVSHVAEMRAMSEESVINTDAKTFSADKAIELGLVDKVMTHEQFLKYLQDTKPESQGAPMLDKLLKTPKQKENTGMDMEALKEQVKLAEQNLAATVLEKTSLTEQLTSLKETLQGKEAEMTALVEKVAVLEKEKVETKLASRKKKLSAVVSKEKAEELTKSLASLDDESFNTVLSGFESSKKAVEKSELFEEIGSSASLEVDSPEMKAAKDSANEQTQKLIRQRLGK